MRRLLPLLAALILAGHSAAQPLQQRLTRSDLIRWDTTLTLPRIGSDDSRPSSGVAGAFAGMVGDALVIAGGTDFPDSVHKRWHGDIYRYASGDWELFPDALPAPAAYGVTVRLEEGLLCIGGCDSIACHDRVFLLTFKAGAPRIEAYPPLPRPLAHAAGCRIGRKVYVAGGLESFDPPRTSRNLYLLDLRDPSRGWQEMPGWEGAPRAFAVAAAQSDGVDDCFYLFSGRDYLRDGAWNVLDDGYAYNPRLNRWRKLEGRFPVMAATAAPFGTNHILLFGGRNARNDDTRQLLLYHTVTGTLCASHAPEGILLPVTTTMVQNGDRILLASGETAPKVRTPVILSGKVEGSIHRLTRLDTAVIVLYFLLLAGIGWFFSRRQKTPDDYFKGGGRIPWVVAGLSIFGTSLSAITFMAIPAKAYATNWSYLLFNAGILLVVPLIVRLFIPFFRRLDVTTAYEYLGVRFSPSVRVLCSLAFILFQIGRMAVVLLLPSIALNVVTGFDIGLCILLMGVLSLVYTLLGGIEAVVWTDALQVVILLGAAVAVLGIVCFQLPEGASALVDCAAASHKFSLGSLAFDLREPTVWTVLIATFFTNITTYGTDQTIVQRYLTTATESDARKSVYINAALTVPASLLFFLAGTALWVFYKHFPEELSVTVRDADAILPWYMSTQLPAGILGLVIAGLFAAAMSTLSSSMNSAATAFITDIYRKIRRTDDGERLLTAARTATFVLGAVGIGFALVMASWQIKSLWDEFSKFLGILLGGLGGLFLLGMLTRRANAAGAMAGIAGSIAVQCFVARYQSVNLLLYSTTGFIACFVIGYAVSRMLPRFGRRTAPPTGGRMKKI